MMTLTDLNELEGQVRHDLDAGALDDLRALLTRQHPADVADVIDRLEDERQLQVFRLLVRAQAAEVLDETSADATRDLLANLPPDEAAALLNQLPMDDVAEILTEDARGAAGVAGGDGPR